MMGDVIVLDEDTRLSARARIMLRKALVSDNPNLWAAAHQFCRQMALEKQKRKPATGAPKHRA